MDTHHLAESPMLCITLHYKQYAAVCNVRVEDIYEHQQAQIHAWLHECAFIRTCYAHDGVDFAGETMQLQVKVRHGPGMHTGTVQVSVQSQSRSTSGSRSRNIYRCLQTIECFIKIAKAPSVCDGHSHGLLHIIHL